LLGLFFDPKVEATLPSETFIDFQRTRQHYLSKDRIPHNHHFKILKSVKCINVDLIEIDVGVWTGFDWHHMKTVMSFQVP
jgi:hypothetical protein